jgi:RecG-like helicase/REP element-mobilizing transposase RayT
MTMELSQVLAELEWVPRAKLTPLRRLEIETIEDLLTHFPRRHEDRREFPSFPHEESQQPVCLCGEVTKTQLRRFGGWKKIFEATLEESQANALSEPIICRWFNLHYVQKMIVTGQRLVIFGKPKLRGKRVCIDHPEFEIIENDEEISIHFRRITPIYAATEGLSQRVMRSLIYRALAEVDDASIDSILPPELDHGSRAPALREIHFPKGFETLANAREHLVLSEFFAMQMTIASRRFESSLRTGQAHCGSGKLLEKFLCALPFDLTNAQLRVIEELRRDLKSHHPMNRLLQGDVGSGKTVVAIAAMLLAVEAGFQAALMAPTQILADQHYDVLRRWLKPLGIRLGLRTAARNEESGPLPLFALASAGSQPAVSGSLPGSAEPQYSRRRVPDSERSGAKYAVIFSTRKGRALSPRARDVVLESVLNWKDKRYELFAACVMPDHVHLLLEPGIKGKGDSGTATFFSLATILHSIKSSTATRINKIEETKGGIWENESFEQLIGPETDLHEKFQYIMRNPWDAGVAKRGENYRWVWCREGGEDLAASCREALPSSVRPPERIDTPQIVIGTHALLYESVEFHNLGLAVIDEQHKFGVAQRAQLTSREPVPDVLVMTATPIPRTLTMTVYGDLDVSIIDEMPRHRGKIVTAVRENAKLPEVLMFLRKEMEAGRQAYVIYPLIDESEKLDVKAAAAEFDLWRERLRPFCCELLHGRVASPEKQAIMERFRRGETMVLISTTVVEVGVDVPNASLMIIENSERFGLAQLHQLRGRIGRGEHKSYCVLLSDDASEETRAKLNVLEKTSNGFEVAEADWELRGPGDLLGTAQSGLPTLKLGNLKTDAALMRLARSVATRIFKDDPRLESAQNQHFKRLIVEQEGRTFSHVS